MGIKLVNGDINKTYSECLVLFETKTDQKNIDGIQSRISKSYINNFDYIITTYFGDIVLNLTEWKRNIYDIYHRSLKLALDNRIKSISLPIYIDSFVRLKIKTTIELALQAINDIFESNELDVTLVLEKLDILVSSSRLTDLQEYVYENYDGEEIMHMSYNKLLLPESMNMVYPDKEKDDVAPWLSGLKDSFSEALIKWLIKKDINNNDFWKKANIDRRLFSKIINNSKPSKNTAILICLTLELEIDDFLDLLSRAGYTLSSSIKEDVVIRWHVENGIYSYVEIWAVFQKLNLKDIF